MTLTTATGEQFVITGLLRASGKTPLPRSVKLNTGPHSCIWGGGSNSLAPALTGTFTTLIGCASSMTGN